MCEVIFKRRLCSGFGEPFPDRVARQLDPVVDVQLVHDAGAVALDGLWAQVHEGGDLFLRETAREVAEDLDLPIGEGLRACLRPLLQAEALVGLHDADPNLLREEVASRGDLPDRQRDR